MIRSKVSFWCALAVYGMIWATPASTAQGMAVPPPPAGLPFATGEESKDPTVVAQCVTVCQTELRCGTLPTEFRGDCQAICRSTALTPAVRACMASADQCAAFADCAEQQEVTAPIEDFEEAKRCDKTKRVSCGSVRGGCGFPQVCCTQIFEGGGTSTRVNVCGRRHCPWWQLGQGPWCGCPKTKDVYGCS